MEELEKARVLVVDDEVQQCKLIKRYLEPKQLEVLIATSVAQARSMLEASPVDLLITDYFIGQETCEELTADAIRRGLTKSAVCMTGSATPKAVVAAMRAGCVDVLEKPFPYEDLDPIVRPLLVTEGRDLAAWRRTHAPDVIGEHAAILEQLEVIRNVADTDSTILISGETGTGKELAARAVHSGSLRREGPFVAINCAAIPESLVEDELFGHSRGAFTGAFGSRQGRIMSANGGTLFLDEIGDMPLAAQAKLLRVIQDRLVIPIGSDEALPFDARIVAASNRDLEAMVEAGTFRADLLFRLSVVTIVLPPLRDRADDILALAEHFVVKSNRATKRNVTGFDEEARRALMDFNWPGNIRGLANVVERAVIMKRSGVIGVRDLALKSKTRASSGTHTPAAAPTPVPAAVAPSAPAAPLAPVSVPASSSTLTAAEAQNLNLREAIERVERGMIELALERTSGNRTEAAALLGLNRTTLVEKLRKTSNG